MSSMQVLSPNPWPPTKCYFIKKNNKNKLASPTKLLLKSIIMVFQSLFIITMKIFLLMTMQNLENRNLNYTV